MNSFREHLGARIIFGCVYRIRRQHKTEKLTAATINVVVESTATEFDAFCLALYFQNWARFVNDSVSKNNKKQQQQDAGNIQRGGRKFLGHFKRHLGHKYHHSSSRIMRIKPNLQQELYFICVLQYAYARAIEV